MHSNVFVNLKVINKLQTWRGNVSNF